MFFITGNQNKIKVEWLSCIFPLTVMHSKVTVLHVVLILTKGNFYLLHHAAPFILQPPSFCKSLFGSTQLILN